MLYELFLVWSRAGQRSAGGGGGGGGGGRLESLDGRVLDASGPVKSGRFLCFLRRSQGWPREVWHGRGSGGVGKARAPERWPESTWGAPEQGFA